MALPESPLTRVEQYLAKAAGQDTALPNVPLTRIEQYLAKIAGQDVAIPNVPLTRIEQYLAAIAENGGGDGGGEEITLPAEYQRVEYISKTNSSGAYINTGYVPELNTDVYVKASIDGKRDQKFFGGFGTGSGNGAGFALAQVGDTWRVTIGVGWTAIGTAVVDAPTDFVVELREAKFFVWIDNQMLFLATDKELVYPLYILGANYNNSVSGGFGGNVYRVTVRRGDTVLRDYIPCYRKSDDVIGMYEIVTETFLTNAGGGSFGKGADV